MTDELIRLQVRVQQLETALRDIAYVVNSYGVNDAEEAYARIEQMCGAHIPTPPSPPTEAHAMRELQVADDDTA